MNASTPVAPEWLTLCQSMHDLAVDALASLPEADPTSGLYLRALILARTMSHSRSVLVLTNASQTHEANIIARSCFENTFWVEALARDYEGTWVLLVDDDRHASVSLGRSAQRHILSADPEEHARIDTVLDRIKQEGQAKRAIITNIAEAGRLAGFSVIWRHLSGKHGHLSLEALRVFGFDFGANSVREIVGEPKFSADEAAEPVVYCAMALGLTLMVMTICGDIRPGPLADRVDVALRSVLALMNGGDGVDSLWPAAS